MDEEHIDVTLTGCEVLFLATLLTDYVHGPHQISDTHYAAKIWHKIVPTEWKEQVIQ